MNPVSVDPFSLNVKNMITNNGNAFITQLITSRHTAIILFQFLLAMVWSQPTSEKSMSSLAAKGYFFTS